MLYRGKSKLKFVEDKDYSGVVEAVKNFFGLVVLAALGYVLFVLAYGIMG